MTGVKVDEKITFRMPQLTDALEEVRDNQDSSGDPVGNGNVEGSEN